MDKTSFRAMVVSETEDHQFIRNITEKKIDELPEGELLIRVHYSSLNYKDALSATGNRGVTRRYPHTPGIDAAGVVEVSKHDSFRPGDQVIVTGFDLGMNTPGGFGQYIRVPANWAVACPKGLNLKESMMYGTAGFTAALSVYKIVEMGVTPEQGEILVTGATGGVGSLATGILSKAGYSVVSATGKLEQTAFLKELGAQTVVHRDEINDASNNPLLKTRWAGVVDTVGGNFLSAALRATQYGGVVTCCGLVASPDLNLTVYPFILRGINLLGIDSVRCSITLRKTLWSQLNEKWKVDGLERLNSECSLDALNPEIDRILQGKQVGHVVVNLE